MVDWLSHSKIQLLTQFANLSPEARRQSIWHFLCVCVCVQPVLVRTNHLHKDKIRELFQVDHYYLSWTEVNISNFRNDMLVVCSETAQRITKRITSNGKCSFARRSAYSHHCCNPMLALGQSFSVIQSFRHLFIFLYTPFLPQ